MAWTWWPGFIVLSRVSVDCWSTGTHHGSWRWSDRLRCHCEYHMPFKELLPTTQVNLQRRLLSDMSVRFGNSGIVGYLFWEKITFCNIIHVTYHPRVVGRHILLCRVTRYIGPYLLQRDVGGIQFIMYFKSHSWSNSVYVVFPIQMVQDFPLILYFHGVWLPSPVTMFSSPVSLSG